MIGKFFDMKLSDQPYTSSEAHLLDLARLCDLRIDLYYDVFIDNDQKKSLTDMTLDSGHEEILAFINSCEAYIETRRKKALTAGVFLPIEYIRYVFELDEFEYFTLVASLMPYLSMEFERKYRVLNNHESLGYPYLETCSKLYYLQNSLSGNMLRHHQFANNKVKYLYDRSLEVSSTSWLNYPLRLSDRVAYFILGVKRPDEVFKAFEHFYPEMSLKPLTPSIRPYKEKVDRFITGQQDITLLLTGHRGIGKKYILKTIACERELPVLTIDGQRFQETYTQETLYNAVRNYIIDQPIVCIDKVSDFSKEMITLVKTLKTLGASIVITSQNKDIEWQDRGLRIIKLHIEMPSVLENQSMWWDALLGYEGCETVDISWLCNRFRFTIGDIKTIVKRGLEKSLIEAATNKAVIRDGLIKEEAKEHFKEHLSGLVTPIRPMFNWEKLIISPQSTDMLRSACNMVKYKDVVYEKYGLNDRIAYGKGINVLFKGPPGTGKTMAAQVMANHLDMGLYKVDLSQLVSKYIGETEKNIKTIFEACENSNVILFFDEMDALFAKRTEVSDSNDRHANLEIAYLLQSLESYEGMVLMATNYVENIDEAFIRRIQFIVDFHLPNKGQREQIFRDLLDYDIPVSEDLDYGVVSQFDLSGGEIKNIVVASIYSAVDENEPVATKHLVRNIRLELEKQGKLVSSSDFGKYRIYLE